MEFSKTVADRYGSLRDDGLSCDRVYGGEQPINPVIGRTFAEHTKTADFKAFPKEVAGPETATRTGGSFVGPSNGTYGTRDLRPGGVEEVRSSFAGFCYYCSPITGRSISVVPVDPSPPVFGPVWSPAI